MCSNIFSSKALLGHRSSKWASQVRKYAEPGLCKSIEPNNFGFNLTCLHHTPVRTTFMVKLYSRALYLQYIATWSTLSPSFIFVQLSLHFEIISQPGLRSTMIAKLLASLSCLQPSDIISPDIIQRDHMWQTAFALYFKFTKPLKVCYVTLSQELE